ncbi:MAG: hypothetical protein WC378_19325 [Opitutaceae bacterium]|jgi:hypothetical protein
MQAMRDHGARFGVFLVGTGTFCNKNDIMKADQLQGILDQWNRNTFESLGAREKTQSEKSGAQIFPEAGLEKRRCYCGKVTKAELFPGELTHKKSGNVLAIGAVFDQKTDNTEDDLDVVVAVGINYGQFFGQSCVSMITDPAWRDTKMWKRLHHTFTYLDAECFEGEIAQRGLSKFHLVAVNFFPWITRKEWTDKIKLNAIAEAMVLRCYGFDHPAARIADLVELIGHSSPGSPNCAGVVPFVVFHGAGCAVPYLGVETVRILLSPASIHSNYVFCDNLSRPLPPRNTAVLLPKIPLMLRRKNVHVLDDS